MCSCVSVVVVVFLILIVGQCSVQVRNKLPEGSICPQRWHRGHVFVLAQWFFSSSPWCWLSRDCRLGQCMWEDLLCVPPPGASCQIGQHHEGNWFPPWQTPRHSITEAPHQLVRNSDAQQQKTYLWIPDSCTVQLVIQSMQVTHALCLSPHNITSHTLQHLHIYSNFTHTAIL